MREVSEAVDGGAAESHRPVSAIQSTERGGGVEEEERRRRRRRGKNNWVGRSLFLAWKEKTKRRCEPARILNISVQRQCKSTAIRLTVGSPVCASRRF